MLKIIGILEINSNILFLFALFTKIRLTNDKILAIFFIVRERELKMKKLGHRNSTAAARCGQSHPASQGSKWVRPDKRLAIHLRDGLACCYCGHSLEDGASLELDHVIAWSQGGSNEAQNLITACKKCNCSRGNREIEQFVGAVAEYLDHGLTADALIDHIAACLSRPLDRAEAKKILARRREERE